MKKICSLVLSALLMPMTIMADGWPANYGGVMLQGFYWDSYSDTNWMNMEKQADELSRYFSLIWIPQSGYTGGWMSMGYDPLYYFRQDSSFGTEDELRSLIKTMKGKGTGMIADVVVNHRKNLSNWVDFPAETYNGVTYQMLSTDICGNDDGGATKTWATTNGYSLSANNDEGEGWSGMRDLDHKSANVQKCVKAYVKYLVEDLGYTGFRYDMVKGFNGSHVADYNTHAGVEYSVGECWDSNSTIEKWIDATGKKSAAFDFQYKYNVRDAVNGGQGKDTYSGTSGSDWSLLSSKNDNNLIHDSNYRQYSVTFVENHDTQVRADGTANGPLRADTLAANAFLLATPGTPCVFLPHWLAYKKDIKQMIDVRKQIGVTNTSTYSFSYSQKTYAGVRTKGSNGELLAVVGSGANKFEPNSSWTEVASGYHYKYYAHKKCEMAFVDTPSGTYTDAFKVKLIAASQSSDAKLVYTTDGTTPTAGSTQVASGTSITVSKDCTLKVGLLKSGSVSAIISRDYAIKSKEEQEEASYVTPKSGYTFHAYFLAPAKWTSTVKAWVWNETTSGNYTGGNWPGQDCYKIGKASDGRYVWMWCYYGDLTEKPSHIIFDNGSSGVGTNQTKDMTFTDGGWYQLSSTKADPSLEETKLGISNVDNTDAGTEAAYNLQGIRVDDTYKGIVIKGGRKYLRR